MCIRDRYWLSVGAQPSEPVQRILEKTGDWQKFKGLPAPEPLKVAAARVDRTAVYEAEAQAAAGLAEPKPAKRAEPRAARAAKKAAAAEPAAAPAAAAVSPEPAAAPTTEEPAGADAGNEN